MTRLPHLGGKIERGPIKAPRAFHFDLGSGTTRGVRSVGISLTFFFTVAVSVTNFRSFHNPCQSEIAGIEADGRFISLSGNLPAAAARFAITPNAAWLCR
jgi:hypothetical protein